MDKTYDFSNLIKAILNTLSFLILGLLVFGLMSFFTRQNSPQYAEITLGKTNLRVELATTNSQLERGLSNRRELKGIDGMLFVFGQESILKFWMRDTLIDLYIVFFDRNGSYINCHRMVAMPVNTPSTRLQNYESIRPALYALELPMTSALGEEYCSGNAAYSLKTRK